MGRVVIHVGLHKTATRFLQRAVFRSLDDDYFLFNPPILLQAIKGALQDRNATARDTLSAAAEAARKQAGDRILVISEPAISGNMYNQHYDHVDNITLIREVFPDARIIYFVRRHSDWLQSAYRQSLVKGRGIPIETFLNYYHGEFQPRLAPRVFGARNVDALGLRFLEIYRAYAHAFGAEHVYLFRQEDLRHRTQDVYARLAEALDVSRLPPLPERVSANRAFSALAIDLFFPRTHQHPRQPEPKDTWGRPPLILRKIGKPWRKIRTAIIRHVFDRVIYHDRDLLARSNMRAKLDAHYGEEYSALASVADSILEHGPGLEALGRAASSGETGSKSEGMGARGAATRADTAKLDRGR